VLHPHEETAVPMKDKTWNHSSSKLLGPANTCFIVYFLKNLVIKICLQMCLTGNFMERKIGAKFNISNYFPDHTTVSIIVLSSKIPKNRQNIDFNLNHT
jgi:hypothetical protein